jgi:hypothetical protein
LEVINFDGVILTERKIYFDLFYKKHRRIYQSVAAARDWMSFGNDDEFIGIFAFFWWIYWEFSWIFPEFFYIEKSLNFGSLSGKFQAP